MEISLMKAEKVQSKVKHKSLYFILFIPLSRLSLSLGEPILLL